jgi:hypothetical protein
MNKRKNNKRFQIEILFDGDAVDAISESCTPLANFKNWHSLSWISEQKGWDPDSPQIFAITFLSYLIYERIDLLKDRANFLHHKLLKLPNKKMIEEMKQLFVPGKELLKISSSLRMRNYNNLKDGDVSTIIFEKGKDLIFYFDIIFVKRHWQVKSIRKDK